MAKKTNSLVSGLLEALKSKDPRLTDILRSFDTRLGNIENFEEEGLLSLISQLVQPRSYTPVITAVTTNPTMGNSTRHGAYVHFGPLVYVEFEYVYGNAGVNAGSGIYSISLPVEALTLNGMLPASLYLQGTSAHNATAEFNTSSTVAIWLEDIVAYAAHNVPAAWTATSYIRFAGFYLSKRPA